MNTLLWSTLVVLVVLGILVQLRANRLDRLHIRTDAAAAGLRAALERRAVVARAVAALMPGPAGAELRAAADHAEHAAPDEREPAENELTHALATVSDMPADLRAELVEAEQRVLLARRLHNDAVRDTLALRGTRLARWFRLAGTARAPRYFEIAEEPLTSSTPMPAPTPAPLPAPLSASAVAPANEPVIRTAARVVLLDGDGRVLLFHGADPARPDEPFWFTVGGGVDDDEDPRSAAVRELREETGLRVDGDALVGPVWQRDVRFGFDGTAYAAREWFYVARCEPGQRVDTAGFTELERATVRGHRWWSAEELRETTQTVHPEQLAELLPAVGNGWDGSVRLIT